MIYRKKSCNFVSIMKCVNKQYPTAMPYRCRLAATFLAALVCLWLAPELKAQQFALKTNVLYDATATINLGAELKVAPRWSVDLSGNLNAWSFSEGKRWKHWMAQPEVRYWLCDATAGHFFALHAIGGKYNFGHLSFARDILGLPLGELRDNRFEGWVAGGGIGYGYAWILGTHWNLEAEIALGYIYTDYTRFECEGCGRKTGDGHKGFFSPTKAALNVIYVF